MRIVVLSTTLMFGGLACSSSTIESVPKTDTVKAPALHAPVDVARDEWGIPHIYGQTADDVAYVQGYVMAEDRLVEMDLIRRAAEGKLAELAGGLMPSVIDDDIRARLNRLEQVASDSFAQLSSSNDPQDRQLASQLTHFAAGVNAYVADLRDGRYSLPTALLLVFDPTTTPPWTEVDSLAIGRYLTFRLTFDADSDIARSELDAVGQAMFDSSSDPARAARKGIAHDFQLIEPVDPTYTLPGWSGVAAGPSSAIRARATSLLALLRADRKSVIDMGQDRIRHPALGSNGWVVGPALSATGHSMLAGDPHLNLNTPSTFYLLQVVDRSGGQADGVMGGQVPGLPGIVHGMTGHLAWGSTTSNLDFTDVYQETVVPCDGAPAGSPPCVVFNGGKVPLQPRTETIKIGNFGQIDHSIDVTFYDVPHHGPIIPRITADHQLEPLSSSELSVRWTGYDVSQETRALFGLYHARTVREAIAALDRDLRTGGQNWMIADDQGHIGWTQISRVPRRPATSAPWKVLPGDGSAEWMGDLDAQYIPHAIDPAAGFLVTANNDPVGVTDDGDPFFGQPEVDGLPIYLGAYFDPGTRVGRITKRIEEIAGQRKLTLDDLQSIQADAVSEYGQMLAPTFLDAAQALAEEIARPSSHPELSAIAVAADATARSLVSPAHDWVSTWSFDTPSGADEEQPTAHAIADSRAAALFSVWTANFANRTFSDEIELLGAGGGSDERRKLLIFMCTHPERLATGVSPVTGDPILFDDLRTPVIESKRQMAAWAIVDALDYLIAQMGPDPDSWRWGTIHTLTLTGLLPLDALQIPRKGDAQYPKGFPRHGDSGTVDPGEHYLALDDFSYKSGPVMRVVVDLDPKRGPVARNVLPGGEVFDPNSPHYRDLLELYRANRTFEVAFHEDDVAASARRELAARGVGRVRFEP